MNVPRCSTFAPDVSFSHSLSPCHLLKSSHRARGLPLSSCLKFKLHFCAKPDLPQTQQWHAERKALSWPFFFSPFTRRPLHGAFSSPCAIIDDFIGPSDSTEFGWGEMECCAVTKPSSSSQILSTNFELHETYF